MCAANLNETLPIRDAAAWGERLIRLVEFVFSTLMVDDDGKSARAHTKNRPSVRAEVCVQHVRMRMHEYKWIYVYAAPELFHSERMPFFMVCSLLLPRTCSTVRSIVNSRIAAAPNTRTLASLRTHDTAR